MILSLILTANEDYTSSRLYIQFHKDSLGSRTRCANLSVIADGVLEETESFLVSLVTNDTAVLLVQANSTVRIVDTNSEYTKIIGHHL